MSRELVAETLGESLLFASLGFQEGLGLPPLEAMAAGCIICGFDGHGGREYATQENGFWVAEGDLETFAQTLAGALDLGPDEAAGRDTAARFSEEGFRKELRAAWEHLLGEQAALYRLGALDSAFGKSGGEESAPFQVMT